MIVIEPDETNKNASVTGGVLSNIPPIKETYGNYREWIKTLALILAIISFIMSLKSVANMSDNSGDAYAQIVKWGVFSVILMGYYLGGTIKPIQTGIIILVIICLLLRVFNITIIDMVEFCQGRYIRGGQEVKIKFRAAKTGLYNAELETAGDIMTANSKLKIAVSTAAYSNIAAGTKMVIIDQTPISENNDIFVKTAIIIDNKVEAQEQKFPSRLLQTAHSHYAEPILPYNIKKENSSKTKKEDFVTYHPGQEKVFILNAGEHSDHYVRQVYGTHITLQSNYGEYVIETRSGKRFPKGKYPKYQTEDFIVIAITATDMRLVFS